MSTLMVAQAAAQAAERQLDSGTDASDVVAIVLAFASLLISFAALYVTALKRAQIGIHQVATEQPWLVGGWTELTPAGRHHVILALYAHNAGANAGILEDVKASSDSTLGGVLSQPVSWYPTKTRPDTHPSNAQAQLPQGIDAGEIEELFLVGPLPLSLSPIQRLHADRQADMEREETFARHLHEATTLPVTVTWRYARPAGLIRNRQPTSKTGKLFAEVPVDGLRDLFVSFWRNQAAQAAYEERAERLVAIATTGRTPAHQAADE